MPISNIAAVTRTLITLIHEDLDFRHGMDVEVTAAPPDVSVSTAAVSVHLLHVAETPEFRNLGLGSPSGPIPVQHTLMGLVLQYVLSVVQPTTSSDENEDALERQRITGHIARALHDYPVVTKNTTINGVQILHQDLFDAGDRIQFILRPAPLQETISFWTTQDAKLARLCLFVEARVAILEPQAAKTVAGIVLSVGNFVFPSTPPQLSASRNEQSFIPPTTGQLATVRSSPARVAILPNAYAADATILRNARLTLHGVGLFPGKRTLILRKEATTIAVELDAATPDNDAWAFDAGSETVQMTFRESVFGLLDQATTPATHALTPGTYGARISLRGEPFPPQAPPRRTNEIAFSVVPQVLLHPLGLTGPVVNVYTLTIVGGYLTTAGLEVELATAGVLLTPTTANPPAQGQFRVASASTIEFRLPASGVPAPSPATPVAVRLVVNGAAATPAWLPESFSP
jgi:hypothetical protein